MNTLEYGIKGNKEALILHGGGLGPWSVKRLSDVLSGEFHVTVPYIAGHAGSGLPFVSVEDSARELIGHIDENLGGRVFLISGLSLGADIVLEMLTLRPGIAEHAVIESANVIPSKIPECIMRSSIRMSCPLTKKRKFAEAQFRALRLPDDMFDDYFRDSRLIGEKDMENFILDAMTYRLKPSIADTKADVHIVCGEKETRQIKKSAVKIHDAIPSSSLRVIPGLRHGEASIKLHYSFLEMIRKLEE